METVMKNLKKKETPIPSVKYGGIDIKSGTLLVVGFGKTSNPIQARILIENDSIFLCQDEQDGGRGSTTFEFKYGWAISGDDIGDYVKILDIKDDQLDLEKGYRYRYLEERDSESSHTTILTIRTMLVGRISGTILKNNVDEHADVHLFKMKRHPDCCGCRILYNFLPGSKDGYNKYKSLTSKEIKDISDYLTDIGAAKIVHLSDKQGNAIKFVTKLGFTEKFSYKNHNSGNTIKVFHLNNNENSES